jgi:DNA-binding MarR family transcriptional regulator
MSQRADLETLERSLFAIGRVMASIRLADYVDAPIDRTGLIMLRRLTEDGPMRPSDLAALLGMDLSTVSRQTRRLEDAHLVVRSTHEHDARAFRLEITERGAALLAEIRAAFQQRLATALAHWPPADRHTLATLLARLAGDVTRLSSESKEPA